MIDSVNLSSLTGGCQSDNWSTVGLLLSLPSSSNLLQWLTGMCGLLQISGSRTLLNLYLQLGVESGHSSIDDWTGFPIYQRLHQSNMANPYHLHLFRTQSRCWDSTIARILPLAEISQSTESRRLQVRLATTGLWSAESQCIWLSSLLR